MDVYFENNKGLSYYVMMDILVRFSASELMELELILSSIVGHPHNPINALIKFESSDDGEEELEKVMIHPHLETLQNFEGRLYWISKPYTDDGERSYVVSFDLATIAFHRFRGPFATSLWKLNNMDNDDPDWSIALHGPFHRNPDRWTQSRALINLEVTHIHANKIFKF
ncbi:uncharacterized protein G2W53_007555 [Senna tora]|uniref:Uncharacterized protein n=1 Tax=Senna tora TaxID=362788 RepID=A0A834X6H3_9FABA|nr:uncharacterized protein G2W53_007555 [Senna tora]